MHGLWAPRRAIISTLIVILGSTAAFATTLTPTDTGPLPASFTPAQPHLGDSAQFHLAVLDLDGDYLAGPLPAYLFEGGKPEWTWNMSGEPTLVTQVLTMQGRYVKEGTHQTQYSPTDTTTRLPWGWAWPNRYAVETDGSTAWVGGEQTMRDVREGSGVPLISSDTTIEEASQSRLYVPEGMSLVMGCLRATLPPVQIGSQPVPWPLDCQLAAHPIDLAHPEYTTGAAIAARNGQSGGISLTSMLDLLPVGSVDTHQGPGVLFEYDLHHIPHLAVSMAFVEHIPYPVWLSYRNDESGHEYVYFMTSFTAGQDHPTPPPIPQLPKLSWTAPKPWGMDDAGMEMPLLPSEAWAAATADMDGSPSALGAFLAKHPDAFTELAEADLTWAETATNSGEERGRWVFQVRSGDARIAVQVTQGDRTLEPLELLVPPQPPAVEEVKVIVPEDIDFDPPTRLPTMASIVRLVGAFGDTDQTFEWGLEPACNRWVNAFCEGDEAGLGVWVWSTGSSTGRTVDPSGPGLQDESSSTTVSLRLRPDGGLRSSSVWSREMSSVSSPPMAPAEAEAAFVAVIPEPPGGYTVALATGSAALIAALLYYFWPAVKLGFMGLFSRIHGPVALEHPKRQELFAAVHAHPGIHFQELVRLQGGGRGTTEHHLRKLVETGQIARKEAGGYACYFPKGTDRRTIAAAPALRSATARRLVELLRTHPGMTGAELAEAASVNRGTVAHHMRRLVDAGVVEGDKAGRSVHYRVRAVAA